MTDTQKVMAPVGGRPFLSYVLDELITGGYEKAVMATGYRSEDIESYFGNKYKSIEIAYSKELQPLGTGGAIAQALSVCKEDTVTVINGDTFFRTDFKALTDFHKNKAAAVTVTVKQMSDFSRYGTIETDGDGRITRFREKQPCEKGLINGGIYCITKSKINFPDGKFSFEKEILEPLCLPVYAFESDGYFTDIGIPEDYFRANIEIPLITGRKKFPAVFLDRDGTVNKEINYLYRRQDLEFIPGAPEAIEKIRELGFIVIVITNQAGVAKGFYTEEDVNNLHLYMNEKLSDTTHIDSFYYCPFHEDAVIEKYRKNSDCRKPGTGMIKQAVNEFRQKGIEIDLDNSILIGDTRADILTGINAQIGTNIIVMTGHGKREDAPESDFIAKDLSCAADYIEYITKNKNGAI